MNSTFILALSILLSSVSGALAATRGIAPQHKGGQGKAMIKPALPDGTLLPRPAIPGTIAGLQAQAPQAEPAPTPEAAIAAWSDKLGAALKDVEDASKGAVEGSHSAIREVANRLEGAREIQPSGAEATPDASVVQAPAAVSASGDYRILERLGVVEKILAGGGIERNPDGTIKPLRHPIRFFAFDNDDNLIYYRTKIYVRHKTTGQEASIPTAEFAEVRPDIGKRGKYQDYEFFDTDKEYGGSFRDFRDILDPDIFPKDIEDAIAAAAAAAMWRGPVWYQFATALKSRRSAPWVGIVTSRGHKPENIVRGMEILKQKGFLAAAPRQELIFGVSAPGLMELFPKGMGIPERKVEILIELLDLIDSLPLENPAKRHSFGFSDDDVDMMTRVRNRLYQEQVVGKRWKRTNVSLFATGPGREGVTVLVPGGEIVN